MALNMMKRTLELLGTSAVNTGKNYFKSASQLVDDSKAIMAESKDFIGKPVDFIRKMSTRNGGGGLYKSINDWFYQRADEYDQFDLSGNDDDGFDSGMPSSVSGTPDNDEGHASIDVQSMKDIARGQVGAMYKIGQKQVQASLANTSEIVSSFNNRSSEIVASINNLNKTVMGINETLNKIASFYTQADQNKHSYEDEVGSIFSQGNLQLGKVFNATKLKAGESLAGVKTFFEQIKSGPQFLSDMIVNKLFEKVTINDKSLSEHAEGINTRLGKIINDTLAKVLTNDTFRKYIGDLNGISYDASVVNTYDKNKAVFDGMTRKTIIEVIPGYLKQITAALTGQNWNVNERGELTTRNVDMFGERLTRVASSSAFGSVANSVLDNSKYAISTNQLENQRIIDRILQTLSMSYSILQEKYGLALTGAAICDKNLKAEAIQMAWMSWNNNYNGKFGINSKKFENICEYVIGEISHDKDGPLADKFKANINSQSEDLRRVIAESAAEGINIGNDRQQWLNRMVAASDNLQNISYTLSESDKRSIKAKAESLAKENSIKNSDKDKWIEDKIKELERDFRSEASSVSRATINGSNKNISSIVYNIYELLKHGIKVIKVKNEGAYEWQDIEGNGPLNLNTNGCGPIALTDLANRMATDGTYNPNMGTSIGGYITAASRMGMNLYPGRVTQRALRGTSPGNPITVMGSGYGFGTGIGQLHYMNIIGSDGANAYTYNPMYGNGIYPLGTIANNSIIGLYGRGSGDKINKLRDSLKVKISDLPEDSTLADVLYALGIDDEYIDESAVKISDKANKAEDKYLTAKVKGELIGARVGDYFKHKKAQLSNDFHNIVDTAKENMANMKSVKRDARKFAKGVKEDIKDNSNYSDKDKQYAQEALSLMNAAIADGDGTSDLNAIKKVIGKIKNQELRSSLESNITDLINRSAKKVEAKPKSKLGKVVIFAMGLLKKFLNPVFKGAKLLLTGITKGLGSAFKFLTTKLPKLISWLAKPYKSSAALIGTGAKDLKEGLFGGTLKDDNGNEYVDENGNPIKMFGLFTPVISAIKFGAKGIKTAGKALASGIKLLGGGIKRAGEGIGKLFIRFNKFISETLDNLKDRLVNGKFGNFFSKLINVDTTKKIGLFGGFKLGIKNTMNSYKSKFAAKTRADENTDTLVKLVNDILRIFKGEDPEVEQKKREEEEKKRQEEEKENGGNGIPDETSSIKGSDNNESKSTESSGSSSKPEMPSISTGDKKSSESNEGSSTSNEGGSTTGLAEIGDGKNIQPGGSNTGDNASSAKSASDSGESGGGLSSMFSGKMGFLGKLGDMLGKIFGGTFKIILGIGKAVLTAIVQLEGIKTIGKMISQVFTQAVKPINKLLKEVIKAIKPVLAMLQDSLHDIIESVVEIAGTLLDLLMPLIKPLAELFIGWYKLQFEIILQAVTSIVGLLSPAINAFIKILVPTIKLFHAAIETLLGAAMVIGGKLTYGLGWVVEKIAITKAGNAAGTKLKEIGNNLTIAGREKFYGGIATGIDALASPQPVSDSQESSTTNNITNNTTNNTDNSTTNNTTINEKAYEIYPKARGLTREEVIQDPELGAEAALAIFGSGDSQAKYGSYLNMKNRGCGPIALADNINRRNTYGVFGSGDIDPRDLATSMYNAGTYNTNKGTSVRDYLTTSNALGYNMRAGGVDYRSLKQASPGNPITLVGSGSGFGTRTGNNHYINVVGTDRSGFAYVSNPLTGKVSKVASGDLIANSKLGIYGSGPDDEDNTTTSTDATTGNVLNNLAESEQLAKIKELAPILTADAVDINGNTITYGKGKIMDKDDVETYIYEHELSAEQADYYRWAHLSDVDYKGSYGQQQKQQSSTSSDGTVDLSGLSDIDFSAESIAENFGVGSTISDLLSGLKNLASNFLSMFNVEDTSTTEGQQKWLKRLRKEMGDEKFDKLRAYAFLQFVKQYPPTSLESFEPGTMSGNTYAARFKLHEYELIKKYKDKFLANPNAFVVTMNDLSLLGINTHGETLSNEEIFQRITKLLGGITSDLMEDTSVYGSTYTNGSSSVGYDAQGHITTTGTLLETKNAFKEGSSYAKNPNVGSFIDKAKNAGMTPAEIATIISTGIWEDGGQKIFGSKSVTATTYDYNGQRAEGIMNWVGGSHATTVAGQLAEIHEKYFNPGSYGDYAKFRHNQYDDQDIAAYKSATGRSGFNLGWGEKYGNIINSDLIEGSEHFFRSALVPESIHNPTGVGNYVGTAVGAYNWMLDKGYFTPTITSGTLGVNASSGNPSDVIKSVAMIYEGYANASSTMPYLNSLWNHNITLRNGRTRKIRPDCSGIVSAGIQEMGYKLKGQDGESGARSQQFAAPNSNTFILDQSGNPSPDWIVLPFSRDALQSGDITARNGHVGLPVTNLTADWPKGLDGGGSYNINQDNIPKSAKAAKQYLNGASIGDVSWRSTMGPKWSSAGGATKIWRYIGGSSSNNNVSYNTSGYSWNDGTSYSFDSDDSSPSSSSTSSNSTTSTNNTSKSSTGYDDRGFKLNDADKYTVKYIASNGSSGHFKNANKNNIASIVDLSGYTGIARDNATKGKIHASSKWNKNGKDWWYYDTLDNHALYGAGDTSSIYVPEIDSSKFNDSLFTDTTKSVNNYYIAKNSYEDKQDVINVLLKHTFNVKSESMEALLTEMLNEIRSRNNKQPVKVSTPSTTNMFDESIPTQIEKLMLG